MSLDQTASGLNPYVQWLGLPEQTVAPNHYELLAVKLFESDVKEIKQAYYRRVAKVSLFQHGRTALHCEQLLAQLSEAKDCLIDDHARAKYDASLKQHLNQQESKGRSSNGSIASRSDSARRERSRVKPAEAPIAKVSGNGPGPRENYSEGAKRRAALFQENSSNESLQPKQTRSQPASRSPFGMFSVVRTPAEIFQEIVAKRGLTPYQAEKFVDQDAENLIVGPYVLESELGSGSCGLCFVASRISTGELVSLRVLPSSYGKKDEASIKSAVRAVKRVESDRIQRSIDAGFDNTRGYVASDLAIGEDLYRLVKRVGPLPVQQSLYCIMRAIEGLAAASKSELTHKELRPSKLIISRQGALVVRDVSIAQVIQFRKQNSGNTHALIQAMPRHHLDYIAPELLLGESGSGFSADLYSLGCILFFLLTGESMYAGEDPLRAVIAHREAPIPTIASRIKGVPASLDGCFARMVGKVPKNRFASYGQCHAALREIAKSLPKSGVPIEQQWSMVDETAGAGFTNRPAMRTFSITRLVVSSILGVTLIGGATGAAFYAFRPKEVYTPDVNKTEPAQPSKQPNVVVPRGDQSVPYVEAEDSFPF